MCAYYSGIIRWLVSSRLDVASPLAHLTTFPPASMALSSVPPFPQTSLSVFSPSARPSRASPRSALSRPVQTLSYRPIRAVKVFYRSRSIAVSVRHVPYLKNFAGRPRPLIPRFALSAHERWPGRGWG